MQESYDRRAKNWVLGVTSLASFMMALDSLVITTAFATIRSDFGASVEMLQWAVNAFNLSFAVLLLTGAVLVGLRFATTLARPISSLVAAAEQVRAGDLAARVPEGAADEEFGSLSRAFNRMTHQLQTQQSELIEANRQLDQRRRFTETVLAGVSAGVIGLDQHGRINLPNRSSSLLLPTVSIRSPALCKLAVALIMCVNHCG